MGGKKYILFALLLAALLYQPAGAQPVLGEGAPLEIKNSIKLYPLAFIRSRFAVSYEYAIAEKWTVQVGAGVVSNDNSIFYNASNIFGYSADVQFRKYLEPDKPALSGIYVAPHLGYKYIELEAFEQAGPLPFAPQNQRFNSSVVHGGLVMGYQLPVLKVAVLDLYAGGGFRHTNPELHNSDNGYFFRYERVREYTSTGVYPLLGMQIGVLF